MGAEPYAAIRPAALGQPMECGGSSASAFSFVCRDRHACSSRRANSKAAALLPPDSISVRLATNVRLPDVRRIYLPRIKYHLYDHVIEADEYVEVAAFWHARRSDGPPI